MLYMIEVFFAEVVVKIVVDVVKKSIICKKV